MNYYIKLSISIQCPTNDNEYVSRWRIVKKVLTYYMQIIEEFKYILEIAGDNKHILEIAGCNIMANIT